MGLTSTDLSILLSLQANGVKFPKIATIGKLSLYLHQKSISKLNKLFPNHETIINYSWGDNADEILKLITGADEIISIDYSNYEGACIIHDMNIPIITKYPSLNNYFDLVIDGGSLEHIFNFPIAVSNLKHICKIGGRILTANPANNLCGHGFYQFSPELMFRVYSENNGFINEMVILTVCKAISVERDYNPLSFVVSDPKDFGHRILIRNNRPVMIRSLSKKIEDKELNFSNIQQSDYTISWNTPRENARRQGALRRIAKHVFEISPHRVQTFVLDYLSVARFGDNKLMSRWNELV